jgi:hypothetical protein
MVVAARSTGISFGAAALLSAVLAVGTALHARRRRLSGLFEGLSAAALSGLALFASLSSRSVVEDLHHYGRAVAAATLAAMMLASLPARPLTVEYTSQLVPKEALRTKRFGRVNAIDTLTWGATAAAIAASFMGGAAVHNAMARTSLNWLLPLVLGVAAASVIARRWVALDELDESNGALIAALDVRVYATTSHPVGDATRPPRLRLLSDSRRDRLNAP